MYVERWVRKGSPKTGADMLGAREPVMDMWEGSHGGGKSEKKTDALSGVIATTRDVKNILYL